LPLSAFPFACFAGKSSPFSISAFAFVSISVFQPFSVCLCQLSPSRVSRAKVSLSASQLLPLSAFQFFSISAFQLFSFCLSQLLGFLGRILRRLGRLRGTTSFPLRLCGENLSFRLLRMVSPPFAPFPRGPLLFSVFSISAFQRLPLSAFQDFSFSAFAFARVPSRVSRAKVPLSAFQLFASVSFV
jgi:hypothetical protein